MLYSYRVGPRQKRKDLINPGLIILFVLFDFIPYWNRDTEAASKKQSARSCIAAKGLRAAVHPWWRNLRMPKLVPSAVPVFLLLLNYRSLLDTRRDLEQRYNTPQTWLTLITGEKQYDGGCRCHTFTCLYSDPSFLDVRVLELHLNGPQKVMKDQAFQWVELHKKSPSIHLQRREGTQLLRTHRCRAIARAVELKTHSGTIWVLGEDVGAKSNMLQNMTHHDPGW